MALDPKQHRYLQRFFPGLVSTVEGISPGEFTPEPPTLRPKGKGIWAIELHLEYVLIDGHDIQIRFKLQQKPGLPPYVPPSELLPIDLSNWDRIYYRLHYGQHIGETIFRFDLDELSGHHVHILPNISEHIPSTQVTPNVKNMDPRNFIAMVAAYRIQGEYPVRKNL